MMRRWRGRRRGFELAASRVGRVVVLHTVMLIWILAQFVIHEEMVQIEIDHRRRE